MNTPVMPHADALCLAPMRGVTTNVYRRHMNRIFGGFDRAMAPFIPTVQGAKIKHNLLRDILPQNNDSLPLIPQCIGREPDDMLQLLRAFADLGYQEANWNLGCPWPQVTRKRRGSGLLPHADLIEAVLERVFSAPPLRFSVKVRLGLHTPNDLAPLLPLFDRYPLSEIIIHPRTAAQMYEGTVDLEAFSSCLPATHHTICYNGDIYTAEQFQERRARFPSIHRWMIGRGALRDPFLPAEIAARTPPCTNSEKIRLIQAFHDAVYNEYRETLYGPSPVLGKMKELWTYLAHSVVSSQPVFKRIKKTQTLAQYETVIEEIFRDAEWRPNAAPQDTPGDAS